MLIYTIDQESPDKRQEAMLCASPILEVSAISVASDVFMMCCFLLLIVKVSI